MKKFIIMHGDLSIPPDIRTEQCLKIFFTGRFAPAHSTSRKPPHRSFPRQLSPDILPLPLQMCVPVSRILQRTGGLLYVVHFAALIAKYAISPTCISHTRCHLSTNSFMKKRDRNKSKMIFKPGRVIYIITKK